MTMTMNKYIKYVGIAAIFIAQNACKTPNIGRNTLNKNTPNSFGAITDSTNSATTQWKEYFNDDNLNSLIDTALKNNQELNVVLQEINISKYEVRARKGDYLPYLNIEGRSGVEKLGRYTRLGALDANNEIVPGQPTPENLPDFMVAANLSWELDIWKKLRNAKKAAMYRYLATVEGKNFMVTRLIAEISNSYYELMTLDNQLEILQQNIEIQQNALKIVEQQKAAARTTELAVRRFEAEVLKNRSRIFYIKQQIVEAENRINFLVGRFPQPVIRNSAEFINLSTDSVFVGLPAQLISNRPDIRQAEKNLEAAKVDIKAAKANFYPSLTLNAGIGYEAINTKFLFSSPESMIYALAGGLVTPLINRNKIKAYYYSANSKQVQSIYNYEKTLLNAHIEVANQISNIQNLKNSFDLKQQQVNALTQSIDISTKLFMSARADYMEVLLTQRDALESKFELVETKKRQMNARVNIYKALGGGWK
jgi:multidrug efflux system outer membrane protein